MQRHRLMAIALEGVGYSGLEAAGMRTAGLLATCTLLVTCVLPVIAQTDGLTPEQATVARAIEGQLIAPCCFRQTLAEHHSDLAERLRGEVRAMVAKGGTEKEVVSHFVTKYGERVLAAPQASGFNLLVYVMPLLALPAGLALIFVLFRRARKAALAGAHPVQAEPSAAAHPLKTRMTEELERFNA
jgi:cytochrome c-type biogenesis protein CcmH